MSNRLIFLTPLKFNIPYSVYDTLFKDAYYFGFIKNDTANINGFLNILIPKLVDYRNDLHDTILNNNNDDCGLAEKIEENIYKVYFNKLDFCDDSVVSISLRISKSSYNKFIEIHDVISSRYNMDFTNFIRSLLIEYSNQRISKREYLFFYNEVKTIKSAILELKYCTFYLDKKKFFFAPFSIEQSPNNNINFVVGYNEKDETGSIVALKEIKQIIKTDYIANYTEEDCEFVQDCLNEYFSEEKEICSD